jgi:RNA polymerase sigma-70 factor (ECF subfamily)
MTDDLNDLGTPDFTAELAAVAPDARSMIENEALPLRPIVLAIARRLIGDETRAEDLVQETYLRAFRSSAQYRAGTNCRAWLLTILRSVYIDLTRHHQARGGRHEQLPADIQDEPQRSDLGIDPSRFMSVLDLLVDDQLRAAMLNLPEQYREALVLVIIGELPYKEVAEILGVQEGTVKSRVFRACQTLKSRLWNYAIDRRMVKPQAPPVLVE